MDEKGRLLCKCPECDKEFTKEVDGYIQQRKLHSVGQKNIDRMFNISLKCEHW